MPTESHVILVFLKPSTKHQADTVHTSTRTELNLRKKKNLGFPSRKWKHCKRPSYACIVGRA